MVLPKAAVPHLLEQETRLPRLFVVTEREGAVTGNLVTLTAEAEATLSPVWSMAAPGDTVLAIRTRKQDEVVHSAGRVLADRSGILSLVNSIHQLLI